MKIYEYVIKKPKITSPYGWRICPFHGKEFHKGLDLISKIDDRNFYAIDDGYVQSVIKSNKGYGNHIWVRFPRYNLSLLFAHCSKIYLKKGDKVKKGDKIAYMGKSGDATGPHLHLGMTRIGSNAYLNPTQFDMLPDKPTPKVEYYVVKKGDTLSSIAKKYNTTWKKIYNLNKTLIDKEAKKRGIKKNFYNHLYAGEKLRVK